MAPEPEQPIEKLLRACAKKKREQAGEAGEMHPATRRLLQQEVARRWPGKPAATSSWLGWIVGRGWLKPIVALGAVAAIALVTWICLQAPASKTSAQLLVKNENRPRQTAAVTPAAPAPAGEAQLRRMDAENGVQDATQLLADNGTRQKQDTAALQKTELAKDASKTLERAFAPTQPANTPAQNAVTAQEPASVREEIKEKNQTSLVAAPSAPFSQRYGLSRGLPPATTAPSPVPELDSVTSAKSFLLGAQSASAVGGATINSTEREIANLVSALPYDSPTTGMVQYGYFAASQQPIANGRSLRLLAENQTGLASTPKATVAQATQSSNQILVSFRLEQSGRLLRIIDRDGSIYAGPIQTNSVVSEVVDENKKASLERGLLANRPVSETAGARDSKTTHPSSVQYSFQVVGTNRSSNQQVFFSGTLNGDTNLLGTAARRIAQASEFSDKMAGTPTNPSLQNQSSLQNLRLSGKLVIGQDQAVQIEAAPVLSQPQSGP